MPHLARSALALLALLTLSPASATAQDRLTELFRRLDRNRDGKVSVAEARSQVETVRRADKDGDGAATLEELRAFFRAGGRAARQPKAEAAPFDQHLDIRYATRPGVDAKLTSLDIYTPKTAAGARPTRRVIVMVHGGGWRNGDKGNASVIGSKRDLYVGRGELFVSVNYRLSPAVRHPAHVQDVAAALAWLHDNIARYGGDPAQLHLMGHSAGGHLAGLVATDPRYLKAHDKPLSILRSVVLLDPAALDLPGYIADVRKRGRQGMHALYTNAFGPEGPAWADASPSRHVGPGRPPMLIFYAGDRMELHTYGPRLARALTQAGAPSQAVDTVTLDHGQINSLIGAPGDAMTSLVLRLQSGEDASRFPTRLGSEPAGQAGSRALRIDGVTFRRSYQAGQRDARGRWMGGTETMRLVAFGEGLYCAIGYWTDQPGGDPRPGGQILVKPAEDAPWQVARDFPRSLRVGAMARVTFTTDWRGKALTEPVSLLLASPDRGPIGSSGIEIVTLDTTGAWHRAPIAHAPTRPANYARSFGAHVDAKTGVHHVFAGGRHGGVWRGAYDPTAPGLIRWAATPERTADPATGLRPPFNRVSAFCVANGALYASAAPELLIRTDGARPTWQPVLRWNDAANKAGAGLRGITAVPAGGDRTDQVIVGARESRGELWRIDPAADHRKTVELVARDFFTRAFGAPPRGSRLHAYNRLVPARLHGQDVHLVSGLGLKRDDMQAVYFLVRFTDGSYKTIRCYDETLAPHPMLVSVRTIALSPWTPGAFYCGGYDGAANNRKNHNTAWVFRGQLPSDRRGVEDALDAALGR